MDHKVETIKKLINSNISAYELTKQTGLSGNVLTKLRLPASHKDHRSIEKLTVKTENILYDFALKNLDEKNIEVPNEYLNDYFYWLVMQRLENIPGMPNSGMFAEIESTSYSNSKEYIDLVRRTENQYPQFNYKKQVLELVKLL